MSKRPRRRPRRMDPKVRVNTRQAAYAADRRAWRAEFVVWLKARDLPGSPVTPRGMDAIEVLIQ